MTSPFYWLEKLEDAWNPDHDIFPNTPIQANYVDGYLIELCKAQQADIEALEARLLKLEIRLGFALPEPLPVVDDKEQTGDNARAILASDNRERMAAFLSTRFGESVAHHPLENLRIFMATAVRTLEQEECGEIEKVIA